MQWALQILGYNHTAHGFDMISHPEVGTLWMEAVDVKFLNSGKPYGRAEFGVLLGHCAAVTDIPCAAFWEELLRIPRPRLFSLRRMSRISIKVLILSLQNCSVKLPI